jgi:hypothetical protein
MAKHEITARRRAAAPVACALQYQDLADQAKRWQQLAARAMTERAETAQGLRITFRSEPGVEDELRELVAVENQCCPWASWTAEVAAGHLVLNVASTGDGIIALHGMFTEAEQMPRACCG